MSQVVKELIADHPASEDVYRLREEAVKAGRGVSLRKLVKRLRARQAAAR